MQEHEVALTLDLYTFGRGLAYATTLTLLGACVFAALIPRWRREEDDGQSLAARALTGSWQIARGATMLLLAAHLLRAFGQIRGFLEPDPVTWEGARPVLFETAWGRGWLTQIGAAAIALVLAWFPSRRPATGLALLATAAIATAAATPLTGHALEHPWGRQLGLGLHTLHIIGGGAWLGSLFAMIVAALRIARGRDDADIVRMVRVFSPVALGGAGLAVVAGSLLGLAYVGGPADLFGTLYGRVLLLKVGLLFGTMALGARNWRILTPRLGSPEGTALLARSAVVELLLGLLLISATAVLVALPAPRL